MIIFIINESKFVFFFFLQQQQQPAKDIHNLLVSFLFLFLSAAQLLELHRGQGMDIFWRDSVMCPTEDQYKEMVKRSKQKIRILLFSFKWAPSLSSFSKQRLLIIESFFFSS